MVPAPELHDADVPTLRMNPYESLPADVQEAWAQSLLAQFPERATRLLADRVVRRSFASGEILRRGSDDPDGPIFLFISGLARICVSSDTGREMTVRYVSRGELVGLPALLAGRSNHSIAVKVMVDTECVAFAGSLVTHLASTDVRVAWPIARYVAEIHHLSEQLWTNNVFQDMRSRVAYHLLELCTRDEHGLVVNATQEEVARAVGSVREVVARTLRGLAEDGLIERGPRSIRLLDPAGLHRAASPSSE